MKRPAVEEDGLSPGGDGLSAESFVEAYFGLVWAIAMSILEDRERAEEAFQQTWLNVGEALRRGTEVRDPRAWVSAVARSAAFDVANARTLSSLPEDLPSGPGSDPVEEAELGAELRAGLAKIDPEDKEILLRWRLRGESLRELAVAFDMSPSGLWSRMQRTLDQLRRILRPRLDPDS